MTAASTVPRDFICRGDTAGATARPTRRSVERTVRCVDGKRPPMTFITQWLMFSGLKMCSGSRVPSLLQKNAVWSATIRSHDRATVTDGGFAASTHGRTAPSTT